MDTQLLNDLFEKLKKDKKGLLMLKTAAVRNQQYELAAQLREFEKEHFPLTEENVQSMNKAKNVRNVLSMVGFQISEGAAWLINETMEQYNKKGKDFSIDDSTKLRSERENLYGDGE